MVKIICGLIAVGIWIAVYLELKNELYIDYKVLFSEDYFFTEEGKVLLEDEQVKEIFGHIYFRSDQLYMREKLFVNGYGKLDFNGNFNKIK